MLDTATPPFDLGALVSTVQHNCHISDAQHAGDLTLCTFLLKMRELYRWENDIPLSQDMPKAVVGDWMNAREQLWEGLEAAPYQGLPLPDGEIDPFESERVNGHLGPQGLIYSGGYGRQCKPHFFIGRLLREEVRHSHRIYVSACEYARDLDAPAGMMQNGIIHVRTEALRRWIWERYEEWNWNHKNEAMARALAAYPFDTAPEDALHAMTETETESVILHELGEARVGDELGPEWENLLVDLMRSRAEIIARAVRDLYADCLSTLPGLLERENAAAIHFHFANFVGMRRKLYPELGRAYQAWVDTGSLTELRREAASGQEHWRLLAGEMLESHARLGEAVRAEIETNIETWHGD
jgi:hypothetical protein